MQNNGKIILKKLQKNDEKMKKMKKKKCKIMEK